MSEKVTALFNDINFDIEGEEKDDFSWHDVAALVEKQFQDQDDKMKLGLIPKISSMAIEMYISNPEVFIPEFNKLISHVKLNAKIKETYTSKEDRKIVYKAISFFDLLNKKQSYDKSYEISSSYYKIPERYLRSIIGSRNNLKRNNLKCK
jgi:hypothetical protein